jgi:hypothetical protein
VCAEPRGRPREASATHTVPPRLGHRRFPEDWPDNFGNPHDALAVRPVRLTSFLAPSRWLRAHIAPIHSPVLQPPTEKCQRI